jgi:hypothetical protein
MNAVRDIFRRFVVERFPEWQALQGVSAVIVTLVYSWTLITSFYKVPSWLFYLTIGQILSIYAYSFVFDLLESLLVLVFLLLLQYTIFAPFKSRAEFQTRSIVIACTVLFSSMARLLLYKSFEASEAFVKGELSWWALTCLLAMLLAIFIPKSGKLRSMFENIAERMTILLYVYVPLSILSIVVIIARNIN